MLLVTVALANPSGLRICYLERCLFLLSYSDKFTCRMLLNIHQVMSTWC